MITKEVKIERPSSFGYCPVIVTRYKLFGLILIFKTMTQEGLIS